MSARAKWYVLCVVFLLLCVLMVYAGFVGVLHLGATAFILGGCLAAVIHLRSRLIHHGEWETREHRR